MTEALSLIPIPPIPGEELVGGETTLPHSPLVGLISDSDVAYTSSDFQKAEANEY